MNPALIESVGLAAASLTTLCWLPQAIKTIRTRDTRALSLWSQGAFAIGLVLWLAYGLLIGNVPLIASNTVTLALALVILSLKLRYG